jgi:hypothetical protein
LDEGGKNSSPKKNNITYNETDRSCGRYGVKERWIRPFYGEPREKKEHFEDLNEY